MDAGGATSTGGSSAGGGGMVGGSGGRGTGGTGASDGAAATDGRGMGGSFDGRGVDGGVDKPLSYLDAAIDIGATVAVDVASCTDAGGEACAEFCATAQMAGLLVCDDFSTTSSTTPREFLPWKDMPSLTMSVSGSTLVFEEPKDFSACYAVLGGEMDFRDTSIEVTVSATTEERSLSAVSWGDPTNLISGGLQWDEHALYLHLVVGGNVRARLSAPVDMAPGQYLRVRMEVRANGSIRCFVDDKLVLDTTQSLPGLPRMLAPGVSANSYPPEQRFTFDDFVVRKLAQP
jgi:hypothetical protein